MSRIYLVVAALFVAAGLVASAFAPTENMGALEAFYARIILIAPPLFVGTVVSALALIMRQLEQLVEAGKPPVSIKISEALEEAEKEAAIPRPSAYLQPSSQKEAAQWKMPADIPSTPVSEPVFVQEDKQENHLDFDSLFASKLRDDAEDNEQQVSPAPLEGSTSALEEERRAPTVDEYLENDSTTGQEEHLTAPLAREGTFAGRSYRMYEDGSLEIDTEQSTIRFDSLDEFRSFVSSVSKG